MVRDDEVAAWCQTFRLLFDSSPAHVALLDQQGRILETNRAWREYGSQNGLGRDYNCLGMNYLEACERGVAENFPGAREAYIGLLEVLHARRPKFTMVYPCHSPTQRQWYRMWVEPQLPDIPAVVVAHYLCTDKAIGISSSSSSLGMIPGMSGGLHALPVFPAPAQKTMH